MTNDRTDEKIRSALRCPLCGAEMQTAGGSLVCGGARRHCFDFSAEGYLNLAPPQQSGGGDAKEAVRARTGFLETGYYLPAAQTVLSLLERYVPAGGLVIDAGCGEGWYSARFSGAGFRTAGFDLSKPAVRTAAKRVRRTGCESRALYAVSSVFALPLTDGCADAVVNIFAPCAEEEYARVLKPGGVLIVTYAGPEHLMGLKKQIYSSVHENAERADLPVKLEKIGEERTSFEITVEGQEAIQALFTMTPYYWRTSPQDSEKLRGLDRLTTGVDMLSAVYRKGE